MAKSTNGRAAGAAVPAPMPRVLIVINGPIASGKSTVARELAGLADSSSGRSAVIDLDEVWQMLDHQQPRTGGIEKWLLARRAAGELTDLFFSSGIEVVVVEGPFFTPEERDGFTRHVRTSVLPRFVTLTVSFEESLRRAQSDPHPDRVISRDPTWLKARYVASHELLAQLPSTELVVGTDSLSATDVANAIAAALEIDRAASAPDRRS